MVGIANPPGTWSDGRAMSANGDLIVGAFVPGLYTAHRWTSAGGMQALSVPSGYSGFANAVSSDGAFIAGGADPSADGGRLFRWINGNYEDLGRFAGRWTCGSNISDDGQIIVGHTDVPRAFEWTPSDGFRDLGDLAGGAEYSYDYDMTSDGQFIVGESISTMGSEAVLWNSERELLRVSEVLSEHQVIVPSGWTLKIATGVTVNGGLMTLCGDGTNPQGNPEAWIARFTLKLPALLGDMNCDGVLSVSDIAGFVLALTNPAGYAAQFPNCDINNADMNQDDNVTVSDIGPFVQALTGRLSP